MVEQHGRILERNLSCPREELETRTTCRSWTFHVEAVLLHFHRLITVLVATFSLPGKWGDPLSSCLASSECGKTRRTGFLHLFGHHHRVEIHVPSHYWKLPSCEMEGLTNVWSLRTEEDAKMVHVRTFNVCPGLERAIGQKPRRPKCLEKGSSRNSCYSGDRLVRWACGRDHWVGRQCLFQNVKTPSQGISSTVEL